MYLIKCINSMVWKKPCGGKIQKNTTHDDSSLVEIMYVMYSVGFIYIWIMYKEKRGKKSCLLEAKLKLFIVVVQ